MAIWVGATLRSSSTTATEVVNTSQSATPSASANKEPCTRSDSKGDSYDESPTHNKFVGETTFQTSSNKLAWLNGMKARHEGEYNPVAGENDFRVYGKR